MTQPKIKNYTNSYLKKFVVNYLNMESITYKYKPFNVLKDIEIIRHTLSDSGYIESVTFKKTYSNHLYKITRNIQSYEIETL